ncbi:MULTISPECIES: RHS repeat protein [Photorhabdus]|uniref:RHS repeat protein n=1 Tax=Photorhabdus TaxID=29487 RepID=UPI0007B48BFA|nr:MULTISPECIES: RHS repeat domain-containing protein [Photorhabdus]AXG41705.1 toxin [Photorhabdus laumondii subsp. laumondii]MCC8386815.1 RHS repeat protein [Photorhabdus laumondii]MCZ1248397.1 RHS repeat protein [Photorhabdus laumondii subsp. laumondii]NDL15664.1 RHS repeat protein [Photorhabdus laumondii subsp. laumondii]NDL47423.1 RHS repeat protein [Photorhabdus laumondii subsp. laumondii]
MKNIDPKLYQHTPTISVYDNRGLTIRNIDFHRSVAGGDTDTRITRHQYDVRGHLSQSIDPRLYDAKQLDNSINPNFLWQHNLTGDTLRTESADAGRTVALNDIEGRQVLIVTATGVIQTRQYEANTLPGRLLSVSEQAAGEKIPHVTEHFIWAGNTQTEKDHNLAGQYLRHYDTAGVTQLKSLSLTENILSQSRQLLADGQQADWTGNNDPLWQTKLNSEIYTTQSTFDATGALLTQTDAKSNIQRLAYNVAGQLKGSWLTLKNQSEQVIIKSLTYSAAGQKLREEHGNGAITEYSYEPETLRLIGTTTRRQSDNKVLQDLRYEHDPVGNIISIRNDAEATRFWRNQKVVPENVYTYDSLYQLISATGREMANIGQQSNQRPSPIPLPTDNNTYTNYTRTYDYDRGGNLAQIRHSSPASQNNYTTDITVSNRSNHAVLNSLTTDPTQVDTLFDAGGHQKKLLPGQDLSWNARGELQQVTPVNRENTSDREWYRYGNDGMRQLKVNEQQTGNSTQQQRVTYLPGLELRTTQNGTTTSEDLHVITVGAAGHAQVRVLHWATTPPAGISNNQLRYSYDNLIGSSQLELDNEGQIISQEEYYPFGGTALWAARNQTEASYKTLHYSSKERDATGLYYYGYRYYQPWVGRWLSADPAGTVDGLNLYRMVRNNPITLYDNDGLAPPRVRPRHPDSEGESESEDSSIGYRALRSDEHPSIHGLRPPEGANLNISAYAHVRAGTSAKVKSSWISYSRSLKVAASWAASSGSGRVVKFRIKKNNRSFDLTNKSDQIRMLQEQATSSHSEINLDPNKHPAINFAKGSQEGLVYGKVDKSQIIAEYQAEKTTEPEYSEYKSLKEKNTPDDTWKLIKSRTTVMKKIDGVKVKTTPKPVLITETYNENSFLNQARGEWDELQKKASPLLIGHLESEGLSPYEMDYISNKSEYKKYREDVRNSIAKYRNNLRN